MKKKAIYMTPATQVLEMEANENILAGSGLSNSDRNDISFSDETFDGTFHSNQNIWDF